MRDIVEGILTEKYDKTSIFFEITATYALILNKKHSDQYYANKFEIFDSCFIFLTLPH